MSLNQLNKPQHQSYTSHVIDHLPWQRHTLTETVSLFRKKNNFERAHGIDLVPKFPKIPVRLSRKIHGGCAL